ncbi:MAG: HAD family phosphatase [Pontiella sp.]|nr:HAD family phosphatase [Pontiella sp.]
MLAGVIFDFDGIIVDSEPLHFRAFNAVLKPEDLEIGWEDYCTTYIGFDDRDAFKEVYRQDGRKIDSRELKRLIAEKAALFEQYAQHGEAKPLPGAVELIKSLPVRLPVALCSGALREDILPIITMLGIDNAFNVIVTAEDTSKSKPDPAPYKLALKKLGLDDPSVAIAIEDTPAGIISAKRAGLKVLAVTNSYDRDFLMDADAITGSLEDVSRLTLEDLVL